MSNAVIPKVAILMGCYNGSKHITEQLNSIESQTHTNWCLYASDDGSEDGTVDILKAYQAKWGEDRLIILKGPREGFCRNFLTLAVNPSIAADYYAFCDQDDVWQSNKLERSLNFLAPYPKERPALYCARTTYVDEDLKLIDYSTLPSEPPHFGNALVQNIAGGNTMVFSAALRELLQKFGTVDVKLHDWWVYLVATGVSGIVLYDAESSTLYRQHGDNLIGSNHSNIQKIFAIKRLLFGEFKSSIDRNLAALSTHPELLCMDSITRLNSFKFFRDGSLWGRLTMIHRYGLSRRSFIGLLSLYLAALLKKI